MSEPLTERQIEDLLEPYMSDGDRFTLRLQRRAQEERMKARASASEPLDLEAIKARSEQRQNGEEGTGADDIAVLIAEVERLRAQNESYFRGLVILLPHMGGEVRISDYAQRHAPRNAAIVQSEDIETNGLTLRLMEMPEKHQG